MSSTPDAVPGPGDSPDPGDGTHPRHPPTAVSPAHRRRLLRLVAVLAVVVLAVDQGAKAWAVSALTEGERTDVVGDLLGLTLLYNPGAALSIATGMTWALTLVAVVVVAVTVRASRRIGSATWAVALGLLLGGALGNLVDRFVREPGPARGEVVDFIAYGDLFVGNFADVAIVGAAGLIVLLALRGIGLDGTREHRGHEPQHRADRHQASPHEADPQEADPPQADPRDAGPNAAAAREVERDGGTPAAATRPAAEDRPSA